MRTDKIITKLLLLIFLSLPVLAMSGSLDAPGAPAVGSGMSTTIDIFNRLDTGAASSVPGSFQEPAAGPTVGTGRTLAEIEGKLPEVDDTDGLTPSETPLGKTFWGLNQAGGGWGLQTGANANVVDTGSGTATSADIGIGKKAWVSGVEITGSPACSGTIYNAGAGGTRWCDNSDGSIIDMQSGLIWMQDSSGLGKLSWSGALVACVEQVKSGAYGLSDGSVAGDWRLPTQGELSGLANGSEALRSLAPGPFVSVNALGYWSSTTYTNVAGVAWAVLFGDGDIGGGIKTGNDYVRCVR